jgi:hypothetical protein
MEFQVEQAASMLRRTPAVLRALLENASPEWLSSRRAPGAFSPFDVVGHLVHGERANWIPRLRLILEQGSARPFEPFDRFAMVEASRGKAAGELLAEFESLRAASLEDLAGFRLDPEKLARQGLHPEFGRVTAGQLIATWVVHDLGHLAQIAQALAHRYTEDVGPWKAYLSILRDPA